MTFHVTDSATIRKMLFACDNDHDKHSTAVASYAVCTRMPRDAEVWFALTRAAPTSSVQANLDKPVVSSIIVHEPTVAIHGLLIHTIVRTVFRLGSW